MMEWISVKDKLPKEGHKVLLYRPKAHLTQDPHICIGWLTRFKNESPQGVVHYFDCWCHPTHWMPIPDAPRARKS